MWSFDFFALSGKILGSKCLYNPFLFQKGTKGRTKNPYNQGHGFYNPFIFNDLAFSDWVKPSTMTTELQTQNSTTGLYSRSFIRDGIEGNYDVVYAMVRTVRNTVDNDKGFERFSKGLIINAKADGYSPRETVLRIIFDYVKNLKYVADIAGRVENIKTARSTLSDGYGDCDDQAVLVASIVGCLGFEKTSIAMARYDKNSTSFDHVYCVVYDNDKRYVLDTTLPNARFNEEVPAVEIKELSIFDDVPGLDGFGGIWNNSKHYGSMVGRALVSLAPKISDTLPIGFLPGTAFATGAEMLNSTLSSGQTSINTVASKINRELDTIILDLLNSRIALDVARSTAVKHAAQISAVEYPQIPNEDYQIITQSVKTKLAFIRDFESYAAGNNIPTHHLNPHLMLCAGLALTGTVISILYQQYFLNRR